jgi:hypothetical protein
MDSVAAARLLARRINAPPGAITVVAWQGDGGQEIRVRFEERAEHFTRDIPNVFTDFLSSKIQGPASRRTACQPVYCRHASGWWLIG